MNHPAASKINWTALTIAVLGAAVAFDLIPKSAQEPLTEVVMILGPAMIVTFRTWFTDKTD